MLRVLGDVPTLKPFCQPFSPRPSALASSQQADSEALVGKSQKPHSKLILPYHAQLEAWYNSIM